MQTHAIAAASQAPVTPLWHHHLNIRQYIFYFMNIKWYIIHMTQILYIYVKKKVITLTPCY